MTIKDVMRIPQTFLGILFLCILPSTRADSPSPSKDAISLQAHIQKVRQEVLTGDSNLAADDQALKAEIENLKHAPASLSPRQRLALHQRIVAHENSIKAGSIKIDPALISYL